MRKYTSYVTRKLLTFIVTIMKYCFRFYRQRSSSDTDNISKNKNQQNNVVGQKLIETEKAETGNVSYLLISMKIYIRSKIGIMCLYLFM